MRWNKKGALELSITAIVVLIIAITVLGLAIFFIKNLFGESTELITSQLAQVKEQLRSNMEDTGELVVFSKGTELRAKRGEKVEFYIGVRNQNDFTTCYRVAMRCLKPFSTEGSCSTVQPGAQNTVVGGYGVEPADNWFPVLLQEFDIERNDIQVSPITMRIAGTPDTYLAAMEIYQAESDCAGSDWGETGETIPWQTKRFHVELR